MKWKWFPWRYLVRNAARRRGFLDPIKVLSQTQNFVQPSEVAAPTELLRLGVVLHARGLMNSLAIQHNPDWIWPYWAECQYDPRNDAFIPRAFSLTQINLTHRNWTAIGVPISDKFAIVDPRGLVTPHYDGWSLDAWIIPHDGPALIPSRLPMVDQKLNIDGNLLITTKSYFNKMELQTKAQVESPHAPVCRLEVTGFSPSEAWLVVSLRPYNPEGVSFIHDISLQDNRRGLKVDKKYDIYFDTPMDQCEFSYYRHGDVYSRLPSQEDKTSVWCKVGMATAAAMYKIKAGDKRKITIEIPLTNLPYGVESYPLQLAEVIWEESLKGKCRLQIPDEHFQFLYDTAVRTLILHSPKEVYPGPFLYKRFWFRDAAFILNALLCAGFKDRVAGVLDGFRHKQTRQGYFLSQEGEWDSNGEALWIMRQYCVMTGAKPSAEWQSSIDKGGRWIHEKRLPANSGLDHAGLLPAGFSAEHFGPNDFYYWDDFWGVAGLKSAAFLSKDYKDIDEAEHFEEEAQKLSGCIDQSLEQTAKRLKRLGIPASPYRRLDTAAIGSLVASYPLRLWKADDSRILDTVDFLMKNCLINNAFFHDMAHSGINPYLTLSLAQVLLRVGDPRYFDLMTAIANLASPTGQWPEAIHPRMGSGCMGDGQHAWASAEWIMMIRNCFVREEEGRLILCSGIPKAWLEKQQPMYFGPAPTEFGDVEISIKFEAGKPKVEWKGRWHAEPPQIEVRL
jgi:hypothetical protein